MKTYSLLKLLNTESGEVTLLHRFEGTVEAPNFMTNGTDLIYNSEGSIFRYNIPSDSITKINTGSCIGCNNDHVLSLDNKTLYISAHKGDWSSRVYSLPIEGGEPKLITKNSPSYLHGVSPDEKELAYCADRGGNYDIYTISTSGGEETRLTTAEGLDDGPEYSPSGSYIWFNSVRSGLMQVWRMRKDGSEQTQMTHTESNNWFPHVSPDGKRVVYISYKKGDVAPGDHPKNKNVELRIMNADGSDDRSLLPLFGGQGTLNVNSWAPDSKTIAFVSYEIE